MGSKVALFLVLCLAIVLLISTEISATDVSEAVVEPESKGTDQYGGGGGYYGGGRCRYGNCGRCRYGNCGGGGGGGGGGGRYCRYGCCRRGYYGCSQCCYYAGQKADVEVDAKPEAKPQN